ncbi:hypothetical protein [Actinoplanes aureus]|uniref:Thrombospondin n=1 Tax=Actinoplanes aureus TaxID=2792083 RepID=A0A931CBH1_9ACTN|nr:hypothetical protein [Actinoplanes aureus]MBG0561835.1 hypothetical protein [Actinoplanes aureus]
MRIPTFSRQSTADNSDDHTTTVPPVAPRRDDTRTTTTIPAARTETERAATVSADRPDTDRPVTDRPAAGRAVVDTPTATPKPRASFLATLGLILGVAGALLVLSGPMLGYGIGVAAVGLILSLAGLNATRKRHVAGKTDALIGLFLSIGAVVVGVLALTGQLSWLGTDMQPVTDLRNWLDTQFETRF